MTARTSGCPAPDSFAASVIITAVVVAARLIADALATGKRGDVVRTLGHVLLREDSGFHQFLY